MTIGSENCQNIGFFKVNVLNSGYSSQNVNFLLKKLSKFWFFKKNILNFVYSARNVNFLLKKLSKFWLLSQTFSVFFRYKSIEFINNQSASELITILHENKATCVLITGINNGITVRYGVERLPKT